MGERLNQDAVTAIARITHEVNRAYCEFLGDTSQERWEEAPRWQRESAEAGVRNILEGIVTRPEQSHEQWFKFKQSQGWKYGEKKDPEKKEHPCFVPYDQLPREQQLKDSLFFATVKAAAKGFGIETP